MDRLIAELELLIEKTGDYFDDELTAQLNMTKGLASGSYGNDPASRASTPQVGAGHK